MCGFSWPRGWKWDKQLAADLLQWSLGLLWMDGEVSYAELRLDLELTISRALLARPEHNLRMTGLPLQEKACVLRWAIRAQQPHPVVGRLLQGDGVSCYHLPTPLGGRTCLGLTKHPYFVNRVVMVRQLEHLAVHCTTLWHRRLWRPLVAAAMHDFSGGFYPPGGIAAI